MKIFGREFSLFRRKESMLTPVTSRGSWLSVIREPFTGAWQQNVEIDTNSVLAHPAVFACITQIANDMGKMRPKLVEQDADGIWTETTSPAFSPVLRRPNRFQNHIQFKEWWVYSLLTRGNAYALKERDDRGIVIALHLLEPTRVQPMIAADGAIFYDINADNLSGIEKRLMVPASEIIHDRINCLFHPLVGLSPIFACGLAATKGIKIENNMAVFFANASRPSGILVAPGPIADATAASLKSYWDENFGGANRGKVAVVGDGLKYEALTMSAEESQLIEQLKWSAEVVCSVFHVPPFKIGVGVTPTYQNAEILNQIYYSDCLQSHIERFEAAMDEGLGLEGTKDGKRYGVELDLDALLRMDTATQIRTLGEAVKGALMSPDEARRRLDLKKVAGGDSVYLQQQNYSLEALAKRDAREDPFATAAPPVAPAEPKMLAEPMDDDEKGLDPSQSAYLRDMLKAVREGSLPKESAKVAIATALPLIDATKIAAMVDPIAIEQLQMLLPLSEEPEEMDADEARGLLLIFEKAVRAEHAPA